MVKVIGCAGVELTGVCRNRGAVGGLQALTALENVFSRVSLQPLPAQGGFHAAYAGKSPVSCHNNFLPQSRNMKSLHSLIATVRSGRLNLLAKRPEAFPKEQ